MDFRENKSRLILIVIALGAALVIAVASCGGGGDGGEETGSDSAGSGEGRDDGEGNDEPAEESEGNGEDDEPQEVLAEVTGQAQITIAITNAERSQGNFVTVEGTIRNDGDDVFFDTLWAGNESALAVNSFSMAGASLVARDEDQGRRYLILRDTDGRCLCTNFGAPLNPGQTLNWFAQFPAPDPGTNEVDFYIGQMPPATIEIR
ncbi:hypothetical protein RM780_25930 [Streptomyces sp. DSM 44917]|uniref:DUF4352 domain-containing protein n=1 Tax=Streptomyces boetiae TaxID=3075541 RepID=A0ABU2LFQ3_9ACTN|nr:hypothetical protein [Streptomyces sp. DSM 44917]MDT0310362.1 hypothetical protein [Streptomyces sp. DSM 44917]